MTSSIFWRRRKVRQAAAQSAFVGLVLLIALGGILIAQRNLATLGITSGFDFLWKSTAWEMNFALLGAAPEDPYWWYLLNGVANTLFLGLISLFFATFVGLGVGLARSSTNAPARLLGTIYVETFRNIPLIVQVFFWYAVATRLPGPREAGRFGDMLFSARGIYLPGLNVTPAAIGTAVGLALLGAILFLWVSLARRFRGLGRGGRRALRLGLLGAGLAGMGIALMWGRLPDTPLVSLPELKGLNIRGGLRIQPEIYALAFAIAIYGGAYIGEIVRGGFKAVGRGQMEAARALGLSSWQVFSQVRLPLAIRAMLPILINQYVWLIKATTLGIAVGFSDFFMVVASSITHSGQTLEFIAILMGGFLLINFTLAAVLNRVNRAIALKGNQIGVAS